MRKNEKFMGWHGADCTNNDFEDGETIKEYGPTPVIDDPAKVKMMDLVEKISKTAVDSHLDEKYFAYVKPYTDLYMQRQKLASREEAVLLAVIINLGGLDGTCSRQILSYLDCDNMTGLRLKPIFGKLIESDLIEYSEKSFNSSINVPDRMIDDYNANKPYEPFHVSFDNDKALFYFVEDKFVELGRFNSDDEAILKSVSRALRENGRMAIIRRIKEVNASVDDSDMMLILHFCAALKLDDRRRHDMREMNQVFHSLNQPLSAFHSFTHGEYWMFRDKVMEYGHTPDGLVDTNCFQLTDGAIKKLMPDYKGKENADDIDCANVIKPDKIKEEHLFFDGQFQRQVGDLESLLCEDNLKRVRLNLAANGFRGGFSMLFYGAPGTGKTALAKELARRTGRSIMQVDMSAVRDKFVGESEKNVQAIFDSYKELAAVSEKTPVLVLNETDALITRRNENATTGVDKMENAMQNILQQNMEDFDGILIATTNLSGNMDGAFERRFLYKLEFPKPDTEVRAQIWRSKMPKISMPLARKLASDYNFSGGQIENVARKTLICSILHGEERAMDDIVGYCKSEMLSNAKMQKIGF